MRSCNLGNTGLQSSVLGFGCSAIMGRVGRKESLRALAAAWDAGITFYDTARSYGYGESEAVLGDFLRGRRRECATISTKFGILAHSQPFWKRAAKPLVRTVVGAIPSARAVVRKHTAGEFSQNQFTVAILEQSFNESLRKLKTDYVDLLFLHEAPDSVLKNDELMIALEKLVASGKARAVGISSTSPVILAALEQRPGPLAAAQFACNIFDFSASEAGNALNQNGWAGIANHPFGGVWGVQECRSILKEFAAKAPAELRTKLEDLDDTVLSDAVLNLVLSSPGVHVVIPSMMKPSHIKANVSAILRSRFNAAELDQLRSALAPSAAHERRTSGRGPEQQLRVQA